MGRKRTLQGLTLIEILVLLAIIGILAVLSIPSLMDIVDFYRIRGASEELYYDVQFARTEAVKQNTNVYMSFDTGDNWCYGINAGSACDCGTPSSCGLGVKSAPSSGQLTLSISGLSSNSFFFEGANASASTSGTMTFTITGDTRSITVSVSTLGNIQQCATGISGYNAC